MAGMDVTMQSIKRVLFNKGFTLLEGMIAIAVVVVLMALVVPAYSDYMIRAKINECVNGIVPAKVAITEYRQTLGAWPPNLEAAGLVNVGASTFCTAISDYQSTTGAFTINVNETAVDPDLTDISPVFIPTVTLSNVIKWSCTPGETSPIELKYLPSVCRDS